MLGLRLTYIPIPNLKLFNNDFFIIICVKKQQDVPLNDTLCRLFRSTAKNDNLIQKENGFRININLESLHIFLFVCTSKISASFTEINVYSIMFVAERRTTADNPAFKIVKKIECVLILSLDEIAIAL